MVKYIFIFWSEISLTLLNSISKLGLDTLLYKSSKKLSKH